MRTTLAFILAAGLAACSQPADETPAEDEAPVEAPTEEAAAEDSAPAEEENPGLPGTDIYVFALDWGDAGLPALGELHMHLMRDGYDNQPAFSPDSQFLLHTAERDSGETDIWRVSLSDGTTISITDTPDASEYSPRYAPDGERVTYLYQPPGGYAGHAYIANFDNSDATQAHALGPVGYYEFSGDMRFVATFYLGEPGGEGPFTLQLIDRSTTPETVMQIAENPGRTFWRHADGESVFIALPREEGGFSAAQLNFTDGTVETLFDLPGETQDFGVRMSEAEPGFFAASDGVLYFRQRETDWSAVADLGEQGLSGITRMAVSNDWQMIAIVAEEPAD